MFLVEVEKPETQLGAKGSLETRTRDIRSYAAVLPGVPAGNRRMLLASSRPTKTTNQNHTVN